MSEFDISPVVTRMVSHAATLGLFERINAHEPKNAPGSGMSLAIWGQDIVPQPLASGLQSTTVRVVMNARVYQNFLSKPEDTIDPRVYKATGALMDAYSGHFTLDGLVRNVDLLGMAGLIPLSGKAGYINQDGKIFRVMTITVPLIMNDQFDQSP
jgi:hypothetical protein